MASEPIRYSADDQFLRMKSADLVVAARVMRLDVSKRRTSKTSQLHGPTRDVTATLEIGRRLRGDYRGREIVWRYELQFDITPTLQKVLMPGDEIYIPEREQRTESGATELKHSFKLKSHLVRFRARIFDTSSDSEEKAEMQSGNQSEYREEPPGALEERAVADAPFELFVDGVSFESGQTDAEGFVDVLVPVNARSGKLILYPGEDQESQHALNWRHLNPIEELSGVCQRLTNLGFPCPNNAMDMTPQIEMAIVAFQKRHDIEPNGRLDDQLRSSLVEQHGS